MKNYLPIVEVNDENFEKILPAIKSAIADSSFVAIDCELTGLGDRKKLNFPEIDIRYKYACEIARDYAIISLGLSCFTCKSISDVAVPEETDSDQEEHIRSHDYVVQTFDIITLSSGSFTVETKSHKFLRSHGFDFNKLYSKGIEHHKGCDIEGEKYPSVREVLSTIITHKKPIIIHNGLVDLMFLYQSFYADLPKKSETFAADLEDMFPNGVYDTKYISEFHQSLPATFLEYLYKRAQLKNARRGASGAWHLNVQFPPYPQNLPNIDWHPYMQILLYNKDTDDDGLELCDKFAFHGWCPSYDKCGKSHNINKIVKELQPVGAKRRGNSKYSGPVSESTAHIINQAIKKEEKQNAPASPLSSENTSTKKIKKSGVTESMSFSNGNGVHDDGRPYGAQSNQYAAGHRAGFDAFMTGYLFAVYVTEKSKLESKDEEFTPEHLDLVDEVNKIYLMGKNFPFLIRTGTYANTSQNHQTKIAKIRREIKL